MTYRKLQPQLTDESQSALRRYQRLIVGSERLGDLLAYELAMTLAMPLPGALGLALRRFAYRRLLRRVGRSPIFGRGTVLQHPSKISLGDRVAIAQDCLLDGRGDGNEGITLGDDVILARSTALVCKGGDIRLGRGVGIGAFGSLLAIVGNVVEVGDDVAIGPHAYLGGSSYALDSLDAPIGTQGLQARGGVTIGAGAWLGVRVTVLDGVRVGERAVVAAGAVVKDDVPPLAIVGGVPARVLRTRGGEG